MRRSRASKIMLPGFLRMSSEFKDFFDFGFHSVSKFKRVECFKLFFKLFFDF